MSIIRTLIYIPSRPHVCGLRRFPQKLLDKVSSASANLWKQEAEHIGLASVISMLLAGREQAVQHGHVSYGPSGCISLERFAAVCELLKWRSHPLLRIFPGSHYIPAYWVGSFPILVFCLFFFSNWWNPHICWFYLHSFDFVCVIKDNFGEHMFVAKFDGQIPMFFTSI